MSLGQNSKPPLKFYIALAKALDKMSHKYNFFIHEAVTFLLGSTFLLLMGFQSQDFHITYVLIAAELLLNCLICSNIERTEMIGIPHKILFNKFLLWDM